MSNLNDAFCLSVVDLLIEIVAWLPLAAGPPVPPARTNGLGVADDLHYRRLNGQRSRAEMGYWEIRCVCRIARAQMFSQDPIELKRYLDEVTFIKLRGLQEMSHEDLRGDRMFSIFLMQCANLIRKIQGKLILLAEGGVSSTAKLDS